VKCSGCWFDDWSHSWHLDTETLQTWERPGQSVSQSPRPRATTRRVAYSTTSLAVDLQAAVWLVPHQLHRIVYRSRSNNDRPPERRPASTASHAGLSALLLLIAVISAPSQRRFVAWFAGDWRIHRVLHRSTRGHTGQTDRQTAPHRLLLTRARETTQRVFERRETDKHPPRPGRLPVFNRTPLKQSPRSVTVEHNNCQ